MKKPRRRITDGCSDGERGGGAEQEVLAPPVVALRTEGVDRDAALALAGRLGLPLAAAAHGPVDLLLCLSPEGLELCLNSPDAPGAVRADFLCAHLHQRQHQPDLLARAIGLPRIKAPRVIDATAGLGRDAWALAQRACSVWMIERAPVVHALLEDALRRAQGDAAAATTASRLSLSLADAATLLAEPGCEADVVYLDPMFPDRRKSALVKKEMRLFQRLLGHDLDAPRLLQAARACAHYRVVVKRPLHGDTLGDEPPTFRLKGRSTRFDVYVNRGLP